MYVIENLELSYKDIDHIAESTSRKWNVKRKIDALLEISASITAATGIDSTASEMREARSKNIEIYKRIKELDELFGDQLLRYER